MYSKNDEFTKAFLLICLLLIKNKMFKVEKKGKIKLHVDLIGTNSNVSWETRQQFLSDFNQIWHTC